MSESTKSEMIPTGEATAILPAELTAYFIGVTILIQITQVKAAAWVNLYGRTANMIQYELTIIFTPVI